MSVTRKELEEAAHCLAAEHLGNFEFCNIYEDEEYGELPEEQQRELLGLVQTARVKLKWKDSK